MHQPLRPPLAFAHRGAPSPGVRENSIHAFRAALEAGVRALESDVRITADSVPVLHHDAFIRRHLRLRRIADLRAAELPDWLPTLRQLYEELGTDFDLSLDLKDPHAAADVVDVGTDAGTLPRMWLCGELPDVLQWRSLSSEVRLVNSTSLRGVLAGERAGRLVSGGIDAINLRAPEWTSTRMEAFHRHGVWAFAWDVQTTACRRQLLNEGCDAIYSDSVPLLLAGS